VEPCESWSVCEVHSLENCVSTKRAAMASSRVEPIWACRTAEPCRGSRRALQHPCLQGTPAFVPSSRDRSGKY